MATLAGNTIIVTGAAQGVGLATARKFGDLGARLVLADIDESKLKTQVETLKDSGVEVVGLCCDLRQRLSVRNLVALAVDSFDRIDVLVNASRQVLTADPLDDTDETLDTLLEQNVKTTMRLSQVVAKQMIAQSETGEGSTATAGSIVNVSSIAAQRTLPKLLAQSVSSAALDQLTRSMAAALAAHNIRVNAVALGGVMTTQLRQSLRDQEDLRDQLTAATPLSRIGETSEVADAIVFFASGGSSFVTGQILAVDGGRTVLDALTVPGH